MKGFSCVIFPLILGGCTVTVSQTAVDTRGTASDVVDENQKASSDIEPELSIPAKLP